MGPLFMNMIYSSSCSFSHYSWILFYSPDLLKNQSSDDEEGDEGSDAMEEDNEEEEDDDDKVWDVKRIIKEHKKGQKVEYQVEWEGE